MSRMNDLALSIGEGLGGGVTAYMGEREAMRLRKIQEAQLAQQDEDRRRQMALQNFNLSKTIAPGLIQSDPGAAANSLSASMTALRDAGFSVPNSGVVGAEKRIARPSAPAPAPVGLDPTHSAAVKSLLSQRLDGAPGDLAGVLNQGLNPGAELSPGLAPDAPRYTATRSFDNPQTKAAIAAGFGLAVPKAAVKVVPFGAGGLMTVTTSPEGQVSTEVLREPAAKLQVLGQGAIAVDPETHKTVAQGAPKTFAPRAPKAAGAGAPGKGIQIRDLPLADGKKHRVRVDMATGKVLTDYGVIPEKAAGGLGLFGEPAAPAPAPVSTPKPPAAKPKPPAKKVDKNALFGGL